PARDFIGSTKVLHISFAESISDMKSFEQCDYVFTNSESTLHFLKTNGWSGNKSFYLPQFVPEKNVLGNNVSKKDLYIPERSNVIFSSAGFFGAINFTPLFYAVSSIPELYLILCGYGTEKQEIEDIAMEIGVKPRIRFIELSDNLSSLITISEFSIFPFFDIEIQKSILTSFQNKSLVITEKNYLTSEIISDKENAITLTSNNYSNIADIIQTNLTDKLLHKEIIENAYTIYKEKYSEEKIIKQYINIFETLISEYNQPNNF
ncbi:MAG: glycosyltransferase, partial [Rickettsiales bacterium]|nr:glycosyltransferase [Rickettsiales bacterium]